MNGEKKVVVERSFSDEEIRDHLSLLSNQLNEARLLVAAYQSEYTRWWKELDRRERAATPVKKIVVTKGSALSNTLAKSFRLPEALKAKLLAELEQVKAELRAAQQQEEGEA